MFSDPRERVDYRAFLESIPYAPWELDVPSGRLVYVGPQAVDLLGYPLDEWLDPTFWTQKVLPDDQMALVAARASLVADGERHAIEYRMETADHRVIWVAEAARAVREPGRADRIRGVLSDVTHRKTMEIALADSEERLRGLLQQAPDALIRTDGNGLIVNMNEQAEYLLGYSLEEIAGSSLDHLVPARLRPRMRSARSGSRTARAASATQITRWSAVSMRYSIACRSPPATRLARAAKSATWSSGSTFWVQKAGSSHSSSGYPRRVTACGPT